MGAVVDRALFLKIPFCRSLNTGRTGFLLAAKEMIYQPFRQGLIAGFDAIKLLPPVIDVKIAAGLFYEGPSFGERIDRIIDKERCQNNFPI